MDNHRDTLWHGLVLVAFFVVFPGACDTVADIANGTSAKSTGTGGTRAGMSGAGGSTAKAGNGAGGTASSTTGGFSGSAGSGGGAGKGGTTSADGSAGASGGGGSSGTDSGNVTGGAKATGGNATAGSTGAGGANTAGGSTGAAGSVGLDCTSCHGDSTTNNPAPPQDTAGNTDTASAGVGAHTKHLALSTWHRQGKCTDCHTVPASIPHSNGKVDFNWTAPANASNASPTFSTTSLTCTGAYCHGTTLAGASASKTSPVWNQVNETWNACGTACHLTPPPASTGHPASTACETCHSKVISSFKAGAVVWKDGHPTRVDASEIRAKAREQAARLHARL